MATEIGALGQGLRQRPVDQPPATGEMERIAAEFEGVFISQILQGMTKGLAGPGLAAEADDPFASMLQEEYAKLISRSGGIGLADSILREMLKMQEAA